MYDGNTGQTFGFGITQADSFCTVSLVSITNSPTDPTSVTVTLNFTFSPGYAGAYAVMEQISYASGIEGSWQSVGTLVIEPPPALSPAPAVTLTDTTQSSGSFYAGDSFTLTVTGPTSPANLPVSVSINGVYDGIVGNIGPSGSFTISSSWATADVGSYTEIWYVDGVEAGPGVLNFEVDGMEPITTAPVPQPHPGPTPAPIVFPVATGSIQNCNDLSGIWADTPSGISTITWSLFQTGSSIGQGNGGQSSSLTEVTPVGPITWSVSGQSVAGVATLTASNPSPPFDSLGNEYANPLNVIMTVTNCSIGAARETDNYPGYTDSFGTPVPPRTSGPRTTVWTRISDPPGIAVSVDLVNDKVSTQLTGQNKTATLSLMMKDASGNVTTLASHGNASGGNSFGSDSLNRTTLAVGQYGT